MRRASVGSVIQLPVMRLGSIGRMVSGMGFCCSSYKNKTTRTFEHRGEAWRVLVGAKVVLFIESTKLFDGKLFFERRFCCFSISYERAVHNRFPLCTRTRQQIPKQIRALSSVSASSVLAILGVVHEKRGETEGVCHRFETLLSSALRGVFCC